MPFECIRCGVCCENLGFVHRITGNQGDNWYLLRNDYTGDVDHVRVAPGEQDLFLDRGIFLEKPRACPFFRHLPESGIACCTIHDTRPEICRDYGCRRLLILDSRGCRAGKIRYSRSLESDDQLLIRIWNAGIEQSTEQDDRIWEDTMIRTLARAGYTVRR